MSLLNDNKSTIYKKEINLNTLFGKLESWNLTREYTQTYTVNNRVEAPRWHAVN